MALTLGSTVSAGADSTNAGSIYLNNGSSLMVNGSLDNSGQLYTGFEGNGGNTLTITGTLTNQAGGAVDSRLSESGSGDMATLGGLANSGTVNVDHGSTLQINGAVTNSGTLSTGNYLGGNTLTITGGLTNSGTFGLEGSGDMASMQTLVNTGTVGVVTGASLNLTNQPGGITDVVAGSVFSIAGSFTAGANSAFANLTSIEGEVTLYGQNDAITPNGGTLTLASSGTLFADNGSTVTIQGAVNNSGTLYTGFEASGGNTLTITGTLTNQAGGQLILGYLSPAPAIWQPSAAWPILEL